MIFLLGLGNPGKKYERTRHNLGRAIVQELQKKFMLPDFRFESTWNAEVSEGNIGKEKVVFFLPNTFMNKSGNAAGPAARFFKAKLAEIFVAHDDADIPLGSAKLSLGKNSAGHKGVESVMRALKSKKFWRIRIGIAGRRNVSAEKLVLRKLTPKELNVIKKVTKKTADALEAIAERGAEYAMNGYNRPAA